MMKTWVAGLIGLLVLNGFVYTAEWAVPDPETRLTFPRDHGSHADFKIEWWYVTGHFEGRERRFGFQATFFRLGQRPGDPESGEFRSDQIYMAHMGISDPDNGVFLHEERLNREGWDAFSSDEDLDLRNGNWTLSVMERCCI